MKTILVVIACMIFILSCKENSKIENEIEKTSVDVPKVNDSIIKKIPTDLPNQKKLDKFGIVGKRFNTVEVIGQNPTVNTEITLIKNRRVGYGNHIEFHENNTFSNSYTAPCGNDCFPMASGEFYFSDKDHIYLNIIRFQQNGDCREINKGFKSNFVKYTITKNKNEIKLELSDPKDKNDTLKVQFFKTE